MLEDGTLAFDPFAQVDNAAICSTAEDTPLVIALGAYATRPKTGGRFIYSQQFCS